MQMVPTTVQKIIFTLAVVITVLIAMKLYLEARAKAAGIEAWIPVLKLPDGEVAKELLATENSRHPYVRTESGKLYSLWSDEEGGYPKSWRPEEALPTGEDGFGHCENYRPSDNQSSIRQVPQDAKPYVNCLHVIIHSAVRCNSTFALSPQRNIYVWSKCEGPTIYYVFDYYLPRISAASCLQKGELKC